jgi:hypothetical protein
LSQILQTPPRIRLAATGYRKGEAELKRRPNNHRSKHKDKLSNEGYRSRKDRSLTDKKTNKYGVSTLLEEDTLVSVEDQE